MIYTINHITLAVTDIHRAFDFYQKILGFTPLVKWNKGAYFLVGDFWFCLNVDETHQSSPGYTHYAFSVSQEDFNGIAKKIRTAGISLFKENSSEGESLYFLDPDGHKLEIHVGNWQSRIHAKKTNRGNWQDVEWFV